MAEMHRLYGTTIDVEIGDTWRPRWHIMSLVGWVTEDTVSQVFAVYDKAFGLESYEPMLLARYETCAVGDKHGLYHRFIPRIDPEDAPVVRNLQIIAVNNPQDLLDDELPDGTKHPEYFDIKEFMP